MIAQRRRTAVLRQKWRLELVALVVLPCALCAAYPDPNRFGLGWTLGAIERFRQRSGEYPRAHEDICMLESKTQWCDPPKDMWGQPLWYRRLPDGFELLSAGPDRVMFTDDDVRARRTWGRCTFEWAEREWREIHSKEPIDPSDLAAMEMSGIERRIRLYRKAYGTYPSSLEGLPAFLPIGKSREAAARFLDPWGRRYVYTVRASGYELYSMGPDGEARTGDDIPHGDGSDRCDPLRYRELKELNATPIRCDDPELILRCEPAGVVESVCGDVL